MYGNGPALTPGLKGRFYVIHGYTTSTDSMLSVQRKTTKYTDYDCVAISAPKVAGAYVTISVIVPYSDSSIANYAGYYLFGKNMSGVYAIYFDFF